MKKIKEITLNILMTIGGIITAPVWAIMLIIILLSTPKDLWKKYDEHRTAEEEMYGW